MGGEIAVLTQIDVAFPKTKLAQSTKYGHWFRFSNQKIAIIIAREIITHSINRGGSNSKHRIKFIGSISNQGLK
jgi:hypothetical protein